jgi:ketosteroid isomerase-like protein
MKRWTLDDIPWERFDRAKVDPDLLRIVKAASLVEYDGGDYARFLCDVFHDDAEFQEVARGWGEEEIQHGRALGWPTLATTSRRPSRASRPASTTACAARTRGAARARAK